MHQFFVQLIIAYTLAVAFAFTVLVTCLSLVGWIGFANPEQQKKLFYALIVELVVIGVSFFSGWIEFDPTGVIPPSDPEAEDVCVYVKENKRITSLSPELLAQSLNPTAGGYVWGQFYRYRATIRAQLRVLCRKQYCCNSGRMSPFPLWCRNFPSASVLTPELIDQIVQINSAFYTAQWGAEDVPTPEETKFVCTKMAE